MNAYDRCTNLGKKKLADIVAICGRGRELFRPPTYQQVSNLVYELPEDRTNVPKHVVVVTAVKTLLLNVLVTCILSWFYKLIFITMHRMNNFTTKWVLFRVQ
jgi:hypothetical protein